MITRAYETRNKPPTINCSDCVCLEASASSWSSRSWKHLMKSRAIVERCEDQFARPQLAGHTYPTHRDKVALYLDLGFPLISRFIGTR